jgi:hypothetical protein
VHWSLFFTTATDTTISSGCCTAKSWLVWYWKINCTKQKLPKTMFFLLTCKADQEKNRMVSKNLFFKLYPTATEKELAYYVKDGVIAPVSGDYVFSELVNPVFTKDGDNLKVSVSVKYLDNKSKMTQISQYELVLHKDDNWKIVE